MQLLLICIKVFLVRIVDVSLGTVRTIFIVKGKTFIGACIGFGEILLWFLVVKEALNFESNGFLQNLIIGFSYAGGFAVGTYIGGKISNKVIHGTLNIQVITTEYDSITNELRNKGYGVSIVDVQGYDKETSRKMLLIEISDKDLQNVKNIINTYDKKAFIIVNETTIVLNGFIK